MRRAVLLFIVAALPLALGGCETSGFWDRANNASDRFNDMMTDLAPFGSGKKPLPGDRRAVFPEGVPGVQQGVPPELMRGNQQALETPVEPPRPAPEPKARAKKVAKTNNAPAKPKAPPRPRAAPAEPAEPEAADPPEDGVWPPPPRR